jgi:hypothetical protein
MPEAPQEPQNPEDKEVSSSPPQMLLHERLWKTVKVFLAEYDNLTMTDAIGVLEIVKYDLVQHMSHSCTGCGACEEDDDESEEEHMS